LSYFAEQLLKVSDHCFEYTKGDKYEIVAQKLKVRPYFTTWAISRSEAGSFIKLAKNTQQAWNFCCSEDKHYKMFMVMLMI